MVTPSVSPSLENRRFASSYIIRYRNHSYDLSDKVKTEGEAPIGASPFVIISICSSYHLRTISNTSPSFLFVISTENPFDSSSAPVRVHTTAPSGPLRT